MIQSNDHSTWAVYRRTDGAWRPISRAFATSEQAHDYLRTLPLEWETEVREIPHDDEPRAA